ncbi:IS3 family transposase [Hymenobacter defluvii]|uniref:IS3 family transposase n=1 Tax=Hymenobacter defluvii TaxID=2054411 RepID=UPI001FB8A7E9|nr:IS3 family transposase [Hymenobacter defluvii]
MRVSCPHFCLRRISGVLGFSRQAYYQHQTRQWSSQEREQYILDQVAQLRQEHGRMGGRKLYHLLEQGLREQGIKMGRDALFSLLAAHNLLIRKRRRKALTTFSRHRFRKYPNLIRELTLLRPNQVWVADITYWFTQAGCLYISLLTDAYSRRIMGFAVAETLATVHTRRALEMALRQISKRAGRNLIHHSDRGIQYCSQEYQETLAPFHIQVSMTENSDPLENAIAERVNGILKQEYLSQQPVHTLLEAEQHVEQAVFLYNYKRPHLSCDMQSPNEAHGSWGPLERRWKNYYKPPAPVSAK